MFKKILSYVKDDKLKLIVLKNKVDIINYKDILIFEDNKIVIDCNEMIIKVHGSNLIINKLEDKEVLIEGLITSIDFK
jgi:YabP family.